MAANKVNMVKPNNVTAYQRCTGVGHGSLAAAEVAGFARGAGTAIVELSHAEYPLAADGNRNLPPWPSLLIEFSFAIDVLPRR